MPPTLVVVVDAELPVSVRRTLERQITAAAEAAAAALQAQPYTVRAAASGHVEPGELGAGKVRDFLAMATFAQWRAGAGDMLATGRRPAPGAGKDVVLTLAACGVPGTVRTLLEPPAVSIVLPGGALDRDGRNLVAVRLVAETIADADSPEAAETRYAQASNWIERSLEAMIQTPESSAAIRALRAWVSAWRGLALDDAERLEQARWHLDAMAHAAPAGSDVLTRASRLADLALVCLGLGGGAEGSRRLAEGLSAARAALAAIPAHRHPERIATVEALLARLAGALGVLHRDTRYLNDAITAYHRAERLTSSPWLMGACGVEGLARERHELENLRKAIIAGRSGRQAG